jgi:hypothetical protein
LFALDDSKPLSKQEAASDPVETNDANAGVDLMDILASYSSAKRAASRQNSPEQEEVEAIIQTSDGDGQPFTAKKSLFDILKECIPAGSNSVLERTIHKPDHDLGPRVRLIHEGSDLEPRNPGDVWARIDKLKDSEYGILVIEDIDDEWCEALCSRYPNSIDQAFLVEHITGIVRVTPRVRCSFHEQCDIGIADSIVAGLERIDQAINLSHNAASGPGYHIDCWQEAKSPGLRECTMSGCRLVQMPSGWIKTNRFLSCCQLQENFRKFRLPQVK